MAEKCSMHRFENVLSGTYTILERQGWSGQMEIFVPIRNGQQLCSTCISNLESALYRVVAETVEVRLPASVNNLLTKG